MNIQISFPSKQVAQNSVDVLLWNLLNIHLHPIYEYDNLVVTEDSVTIDLVLNEPVEDDERWANRFSPATKQAYSALST